MAKSGQSQDSSSPQPQILRFYNLKHKNKV